MGELAAALQVIVSINNVLAALIAKASTAEIDAAIAAHEARLAKFQAFVGWLAAKAGFKLGS